MATRRNEHHRALAYVLASYPYKETSLIAEVLTDSWGRLPVLARGARRPYSPLRSSFASFHALEVVFFGRGEVKTLVSATWLPQPWLSGDALFCGFYLNELVLKLVPREESQPELFAAYGEALRQLASGDKLPQHLRQFERVLLEQAGYGIDFFSDDQRQPVSPERCYRFEAGRGLVVDPEGHFSGQALADMAQMNFSDANTLAQSKQLFKAALDHCLGGETLTSRSLY